VDAHSYICDVIRSLNIHAALLTLVAAFCPSAYCGPDNLYLLLSRFQTSTDIASKEAVLRNIIIGFPNAGPDLLTIARETDDTDTEWLAIRGIGELKFKDASPFLKQSLKSPEHYVRANAARALGELHDTSAAPNLIQTIKNERDNGVIEQSALALEMLKATDALPALKAKANNPSEQTRISILGAIEVLGSKREVPFFASLLNDKSKVVAEFSAHSIERITGQDFGFPKCGPGPCTLDSDKGLLSAQIWWDAHRQEYAQ
jgi:HEAT repeat protein